MLKYIKISINNKHEISNMYIRRTLYNQLKPELVRDPDYLPTSDGEEDYPPMTEEERRITDRDPPL